MVALIISFSNFSFTCEVPKGIFLLLSAGSFPPSFLLEENFIQGISVRVRWKDVEKSPGKYDWSYLDKIFELAQREHKKVFLRLLGGFWSPSWIYRKGVPFFEIKLHGKGFVAKSFINKYGDQIKLPVVWDKRYLELWASFVKVVGKKYNSKPELVLVHLSGPTFFSAEIILARNKKEFERLKTVGFNSTQFLKAWEKTIKIFKEAFPNKPLALNVHYVIKEDSLKLYVKLFELSYKILKDCLVIQGNWFSPRHILWLDRTSKIPDKEMFLLFCRAHKYKIPIGFQEAFPFSKAMKRHHLSINKTKRIRKKLLKLLLKLDIQYIEIYLEDIQDPFWKELWENFQFQKNFVERRVDKFLNIALLKKLY